MSTPGQSVEHEIPGTPVEVRPVEFQFKGTRNFIHATDMFNAMLPIHSSPALSNIRFSVHEIVHTPMCRLYRAHSKEELNDVPDIRARCQFDAGGITHWLALTQGGGDAASGRRYEYDEERLISLCGMEADGIILRRPSPYTFIESIVAMNKHMHQQLFRDAIGRWMFARIDLEKGVDEREKLALRLRHNLNYRLTRSDILVDGKKAGDLFFSLMRP